MNKRSLISMLVSLCLVGVIGLGATFAYLSTTTGELTNTFTVGSVDGTLLEDVPGDVDLIAGVDEGYNYTGLLPGQTIVKAPYIKAASNSDDAVAYIKVKGLDALEVLKFHVQGLAGDGWTKIAELDGNEVLTTKLDGIYVYDASASLAGIDPIVADATTADLFDGITFDNAVEGKTLESVNAVEMVGCLVQADYATDADTNTVGINKLKVLLP